MIGLHHCRISAGSIFYFSIFSKIMTLAWQYFCFFASAFQVAEREKQKYPLIKIGAKEEAKIHLGNLSLLF